MKENVFRSDIFLSTSNGQGENNKVMAKERNCSQS